MWRKQGSRFHRRTNQYPHRRRLLAAICPIILFPGTASAAAPLPPAAADFFQEMKKKLWPDQNDVAIPRKKKSINAGYYRLLIHKKPSIDDIQNCNSIFEKLPDYKFLHTLFETKYEAGMAAILPLGKSEDGQEMTAEVNLFHWKRSGKKACRFEISYFDQANDRYAGPWIAIDHRTPQAIAAEIKFRPWVVVSENEERKAAFWTGISAFANLLGPVGNLFFGDTQSDKYSIRSQTELSLFGNSQPVLTGATAAGDPYTFSRPLVVKPADSDIATSFLPKKFPWSWSAPGGNVASQYASFEFSLEYQGSLLSGNREYPNLSDAADLASILDATIPAGMKEGAGKSWKQLGGAFKNLAEQSNSAGNAAGFDAACAPAFIQLTNMGVSSDDARIILFAHARNSAVAADIANIKCLTTREAIDTLERFSIPFDIYQPIKDKAPLMTAAGDSQQFVIGANKTALPAYVAGGVTIYDMDNILKAKLGDAIIGNKGIVATRAQFAGLMNAIPALSVARCRAVTLAGANADFAFPDTPAGDTPVDGVAVHLGLMSEGRVVVIALGFAGQLIAPGQANAKPVLSHFWIGPPTEVGATNWEKIRTKLAALKNGDGCDRPNFQTIVNPPVQVQVPASSAVVETLAATPG